MTSHPASRNCASLRASRSMLRANLSCQNSILVFGMVVFEQPRWRCQKQPWTKIAFRDAGRTMSGVPGRSRRWRRNLRPIACSNRRTTISGFVSRRPTRAMRAERSGETGGSAGDGDGRRPSVGYDITMLLNERIECRDHLAKICCDAIRQLTQLGGAVVLSAIHER